MRKLVPILLITIWVIIYIKNKKAIRALPYLLMIFITPIYNILDSKVFVKVFGCGCVPSVQTNMFNSSFNANDLRLTVYTMISILMLILGIKISQKFKTKTIKIIYNITIIIFNLMLTYKICQMYMWA